MTLLFQRGQFTQESARQTYAALVFFAVALWAQAGTALLVRVLFALQDVITPLKIALVVIIANIAFSILLVRPLAQGGLALATSLAAALNMGLLVMALRRRLGGLELGQLARGFLQASAGAAVLALAGAGAYRLLAGAGAGVSLGQLLAVLVAMAVAGGAYALFELVIGSPEARVLLSLLRRDRAPLGV
jgi:putative peptidoglycan lipid II flippase